MIDGYAAQWGRILSCAPVANRRRGGGLLTRLQVDNLPHSACLMVACLFTAGALCAADAEYAGSAACARCHAAIALSYARAGMAQSSGSTRAGGMPPGIGADMEYFIGSGAAGRTFLVNAGGFLFQSPMSWYTRRKLWALSPGYDRPDDTRPIEPACLSCHATFIRHTPGTQNGYAAPPFAEPGIGCERCHGPGGKHASTAKPADIMNPSKLPALRRDSVCAQCHLTGAARVFRAGKSLETFRPGDVLSDDVVSFVPDGKPAAGVRVTSHYERLWQSRCKQASGDRLWCGSCHDPHGAPGAVSHRDKCVGCHAAAHKGAADKHDCTGCHMPATEALDVAHTVYTDHSIPRLPVRSTQHGAKPDALRPFWGAAGPREFGIAYYDTDNSQRGLPLLRQAERAGADDAAVLTRLAYLLLRGGDETGAAARYERALRQDPDQSDAAANLGAIRRKQGRTEEAVTLWREALRRNPRNPAARRNLAAALGSSR